MIGAGYRAADPEAIERAAHAALTSIASAARTQAAELSGAFTEPPVAANLLADLADALERFAICGPDLPRARGRSFVRVIR